jgi:RHS repeat-associated protein
MASFTEKRRMRLRKAVDRVEKLETRNTITEPVSVTALSIGALRGLYQLGLVEVHGGGEALKTLEIARQAARQQGSRTATPAMLPLPKTSAFLPISVCPQANHSAAADGAYKPEAPASGPASDPGDVSASDPTSDWLNISPLSGQSTESGFWAPWHPAKPQSGGPAQSPRGPLAVPRASSGHGTISPLRVPAPTSAPANASGSSAALLAAAAGAASSAPAGPVGSAPQSNPGASPAKASHSPGAPGSINPFDGGGPTASGGSPPGSTPYPVKGNSSGPSLGAFQYFPVYVLDWNDGSVMMPGAYQYATLGSHVDLRAQVSGTTVSSISWDTSQLTGITNTISGANTYHLTFNWSGSLPAPSVKAITLSVTDTNSHTETFTYDFLVPAGSGTTSGGGSATWPSSLPPDLVLDQASAIDSHNVSVDSTSGALNTTLSLPNYNPNVPGLALTYNSMTADPRPIVVIPHAIDPSQTTPTKVSGQITVKDTSGNTKYTGSTWYYDTSQFMPGDIEQIALQADMTGQSTGRYNYTATVIDYRTTNTTTTITGTETVLNQSSSTFGDGWTLDGLEQITSASGGVILSLGEGGKSLWFSGSPGSGGGSYTDPAGEFSTLSKNAGNTGYTRTLTDGTQITFDSNGRETATFDTDGLHITYSYDSGGNLTKITDPYANVTTFTYSGGYLQTVKDSGNRVTTLTHTSGNLTGATLPDGSTWGYAYDGSGRLTQVTDPNSKSTSIAYDSAERASTITRPDNSTELFLADQEQGWTNSGTSGSPAAATLLATASSNYTDPNSNVTSQHPDWNGQGLTNVYIDALGNVATFDRTSNGLATIAIDRLNRVDQYAYDSKGNVVTHIYPDLNKDQYSYNSFSEVTSFTDANNHTYTYTYNGNGDLTVIQDPLNNLTTMTYTGDGMLATSKDANNHTTSYQYDSQDRLTTVTNPDSTTDLYAYDTKGNVVSFTDERGKTTTYSFDAMNRETGTTDALNNVTSYTFDSGGKLLTDQEPTPVGQTARTTTYSYDSMNRAVTVTAPLSRVTVLGYDSGGNLTKITDPASRVTSIAYDALNRPTVVTAPLTGTSNAVTTTVYDAEGQVTQVTDPTGRITTYAFDNRGWVATVTDPLGNVVTNAYTATGKTSSVTRPYTGGGSGGYATDSYGYDSDDRLTTFTDALSHSTIYGYDAVGNLTSVKDANNNTVSYAYDSRNRLTTITDALGHNTVYGYDSGGKLQTVKDSLGDVTTTLYDALGRATTMLDARGDQTTMAFDAAGRMTGLTDPVGNHTTWAFDSADRMTTMTDPLGHSATYSFNADDQLTSTTDRDGRVTTYAYNSGGQLTGETWLNSSDGITNLVTYTFDPDNELTNVTDNYATLTFTYDSGGNQLTAKTSGPGSHQPSVTLTSGYDQAHNRTTLSDNLSSAGLTTLQYDAAFRLTTIAASYGGTAGPQVVLGYDAGNRLTSLSRTIGGIGTAVNTSIVYDAANRLGTITDQTGGGTAIATYVYGYDNADRVTTEVNAEGTVTYSYDSGGELLSASGSRTESYSYDSGGNRNSSGYTTSTGNELTASPGYTYTYDNEGNLLSQTNTSTQVITTYKYDNRNRLTEVTVGGTIVATYAYDALNRRIGFDDNGTQTWTVYDRKNPYADFNGSGTLLTRYVSGPAIDEVFARTSSGGTTAWYLTNQLGSMRDVVNTSGTVVDHVIYDSYGDVTSETNATSGDRRKYAWMEYDPLTGQYYDRARYYDAAIGRFMSEDPMGFAAGDSDLYRYVRNDATDAADPSGLIDPAQLVQLNPGNFRVEPGDLKFDGPPTPADWMTILKNPFIHWQMTAAWRQMVEDGKVPHWENGRTVLWNSGTGRIAVTTIGVTPMGPFRVHSVDPRIAGWVRIGTFHTHRGTGKLGPFWDDMYPVNGNTLYGATFNQRSFQAYKPPDPAKGEVEAQVADPIKRVVPVIGDFPNPPGPLGPIVT